MSSSFLSLVETGKSDITVSRLVCLVQYFGLHFTDFIPDMTASDEIVVRKHERRRIYSPGEGFELLLLARDSGRRMLPAICVLEAGCKMKEPVVHRGEEFACVLEGQVVLELDRKTIVLEEGDAVYFRAERPHIYKNVRTGPACFLSVTSPPSL